MNEMPLEFDEAIRRALRDADNYRRHHCRASERESNSLIAAGYQNALAMLDTGQIAVVRSGTRAIIGESGNLIIPASDANRVLEALFLAGAIRLSQGRDFDAGQFAGIAAALGDTRLADSI